jgi:hypothetical protein
VFVISAEHLVCRETKACLGIKVTCFNTLQNSDNGIFLVSTNSSVSLDKIMEQVLIIEDGKISFEAFEQPDWSRVESEMRPIIKT